MAVCFMHYNFVRIHQTLKLTPAMAAGVTDRLWKADDIEKASRRLEGRQLRQPPPSQAIRFRIFMIATLPLSLTTCSTVPLLHVQA